MKKQLFFKKVFLLLVFVGAGLFGYFFLIPAISKQEKSHYFIPLLPRETNDLVCVEVNIESIKHLLDLDTGFSSSFSLQPKALKRIQNKQKRDTYKWADVHGNIYTSARYLVAKIRMGEINFLGVPTIAESDSFIKNGATSPLKPSPMRGR